MLAGFIASSRIIRCAYLVDTSSGIRMNDPYEKELFGKTFDDVWSWNKPLMEEIEEVEFEDYIPPISLTTPLPMEQNLTTSTMLMSKL
jgi:hypothetical protein